MENSKGKSHFFKGTDLYYLKDVLDYIKKKNPDLEIPDCWYTGGSLNEMVRTEYGILPSWTNGYEGRGHREKYSGTQMYSIAAYLVMDLKNGEFKRHKMLTPIEKLANGEKISSEDFKEAFSSARDSQIHPAIYPMTPKEDLEKAINEAADLLVDSFRSFMKMVIDAYMSSI